MSRTLSEFKLYFCKTKVLVQCVVLTIVSPVSVIINAFETRLLKEEAIVSSVSAFTGTPLAVMVKVDIDEMGHQ